MLALSRSDLAVSCGAGVSPAKKAKARRLHHKRRLHRLFGHTPSAEAVIGHAVVRRLGGLAGRRSDLFDDPSVDVGQHLRRQLVAARILP